MRSARTLVVAAIVAVVMPIASHAASTRIRPVIHVYSTNPFEVSGVHFAAIEHVTVVVESNGTHTHTIVASRSGRFRLAFRGLAYDACSGYVVRAYGNRGSRARAANPGGCTRAEPG
jgi:hypothetical protein